MAFQHSIEFCFWLLSSYKSFRLSLNPTNEMLSLFYCVYRHIHLNIAITANGYGHTKSTIDANLNDLKIEYAIVVRTERRERRGGRGDWRDDTLATVERPSSNLSSVLCYRRKRDKCEWSKRTNEWVRRAVFFFIDVAGEGEPKRKSFRFSIFFLVFVCSFILFPFYSCASTCTYTVYTLTAVYICFGKLVIIRSFNNILLDSRWNEREKWSIGMWDCRLTMAKWLCISIFSSR